MASSVLHGSVIIPAHNEAGVIARCLESLAAQSVSPHLEVVVVANGCEDDTADIARSFRSRFGHLQVVETDEGNKVLALNLGDRAANAFPRVYLDADITLEREAIHDVLSALDDARPLIAGPTVMFDARAASRMVNHFYSVYVRIPYVRHGLVGLGIFAMNEAGRSRFEAFPNLLADDLYVQRLFGRDERRIVGSRFVVQVPRTVADLINVRTRIAAGNAQYESSVHAVPDPVSSSFKQTLLSLLHQACRNPRLVPSIATYIYVVMRARRRAIGDGTAWHRDLSTRNSTEELSFPR